MKKWIGARLAALCMVTLLPVQAAAVELPLTSRAALLMEKTNGQILLAQNENEMLDPASVTKIMTLLLTMDAIDTGALAYDLSLIQIRRCRRKALSRSRWSPYH